MTGKPSKPQAPSARNALWGGRFAAGTSAIMTAINASVSFDQRLALHDIQGSIAHARMLGKQGILSAADADRIVQGLEVIQEQVSAGHFPFEEALEDVHMNIESRLTEAIGEAGKRLHTARSRNDQVATDFRLWVRDALDFLDQKLQELQRALITQAEGHVTTALPGLTHFQPAQPVSFAHHLLAYVEMFGRDRDRVKAARARMNECPLGAAALAGTPWPIDREATAKALGFAKPMANSLDAVSDRDFVLDYVNASATALVHLSRLAEEIILWMNPQFGFVSLSDSLTTGSSIMPQKRNPDAAELVRGKTGRVFGVLVQMLTLLKALPLAYAKDLQEDKEQTFMVVDTMELCLAAMTAMVNDLHVNKEAMASAAAAGFSTATDLADYLVRALHLPFRDAHHATGMIVKLAEEKNCRLDELSLTDMQKAEPRITKDVFGVLSVEASMQSRTSFGGTAPTRVKEALAEAKRRFL
ncbi:MAG TPA: argininosuccinate lyase [Alphaproteobacteria bacterium]|nr:argininosuccinate lyase [Alphaproteobacteria bacterium]